MKKISLFFSCFIFVSVAFAQQKDTPYDFPAKPGSQKWQSFKTVEDMYAACQIPQDVLDKLSTGALIQTCLNYPLSTILLIHNTPQQGFEEWKQHFNGISALLTRADAGQKMLDYYTSVDIKGYTRFKTEMEKAHYTFFVQMIESIMVQEEILTQLNLVQEKSLLKNLLSNYERISTDALYGFINLQSTGRIIVKLGNTLGSSNIKTKIQSAPMQEFLTTGSLKDREAFLQIIKEAKTIATK